MAKSYTCSTTLYAICLVSFWVSQKIGALTKNSRHLYLLIVDRIYTIHMPGSHVLGGKNRVLWFRKFSQKLSVIMHEINMHLYAARLEGHFDFEVLFKMKFTPQIWILYKFTNHTDKK